MGRQTRKTAVTNKDPRIRGEKPGDVKKAFPAPGKEKNRGRGKRHYTTEDAFYLIIIQGATTLLEGDLIRWKKKS